jgi:hypothetical protein
VRRTELRLARESLVKTGRHLSTIQANLNGEMETVRPAALTVHAVASWHPTALRRSSRAHPGDLHPQRAHLRPRRPAPISTSLRCPRTRHDSCRQTFHALPRTSFDVTGAQRMTMRICIPLHSPAPCQRCIRAIPSKPRAISLIPNP